MPLSPFLFVVVSPNYVITHCSVLRTRSSNYLSHKYNFREQEFKTIVRGKEGWRLIIPRSGSVCCGVSSRSV